MERLAAALASAHYNTSSAEQLVCHRPMLLTQSKQVMDVGITICFFPSYLPLMPRWCLQKKVISATFHLTQPSRPSLGHGVAEYCLSYERHTPLQGGPAVVSRERALHTFPCWASACVCMNPAGS